MPDGVRTVSTRARYGVEEKAESREVIKDWMPGSGAEDYVVSANVTAYKPPAVDVAVVGDAAAASASAAALFSQVAGVSLAAAGPVGRAVSELVSAVGGVVRAVAEHHGNHTDRPDEDDAASSSSSCCGGASEPEPVEPVEEKKAGC